MNHYTRTTLFSSNPIKTGTGNVLSTVSKRNAWKALRSLRLEKLGRVALCEIHMSSASFHDNSNVRL